MITEPLKIPYYLETPAAVAHAKKVNLLKLGEDYEIMRAVAMRVSIVKPPALKAALPVTKDFYVLKEHKIQDVNIVELEHLNLNPVDSFHHIEQSIPWIGAIAKQDDMIDELSTLPMEVQKACKIFPRPLTLTSTFECVLSTQQFIKQEILHYSRTKRLKFLPHEGLKRLIAARVFFDPVNRDVLQALQAAAGQHKDALALHQNGCAELLFVRIPQYVESLSSIPTRLIRQKLFSRIAKLGATPLQKMALFGCWKLDVSRENTFNVLDKINILAQKILSEDTASQLADYISSMKYQTIMLKEFYEELFLTPALKKMRTLHTPGKVTHAKYSYQERIVRTNMLVASLSFYPTKDYLDLCKGRISSDCAGLSLSEHHLMTPEFFNIRIFANNEWIGNCYMLDFTKERGVLLLDRIQVPRDINAEYLNFFGHLKDIFHEMFSAVDYNQVLLPTAISNHNSLQSVFNTYKNKLARAEFKIASECVEYFDSLKQTSPFYILN